MDTFWRINNNTEKKNKQQQRVGAFDSSNSLLWWVSTPYICSYFSLITLCYIVVLFLDGYVLYKFIPKKKQHHNSEQKKPYQLRLLCYQYFIFKTCHASVKLFYIWSLIICCNFSCPLFETLLIMFYQWFHLHFAICFQREASATRKEVMRVHVCYPLLYLYFKLFSYNKVISLHKTYLFYSKLILPFTMAQQSFSSIYFYQVGTSRYWFTNLYPMQKVLSAEVFSSYCYFRKIIFT